MITSQHLASAICSDKVSQSSAGWMSDGAGQGPLYYAVHSGNEKCVRLLIQSPNCIHQVDRCGRTVLSIAVARGELRIVQDLISAGADVFAKDSDGVTSLHLATKGSNDMMKAVYSKLTVHNVDITDGSGRTALHWSAALAREAACRILLQAGANTAKLDHHRRTPLHWLSVSENFESTSAVATLFLRTYPDLVRWQDVRGATAFHLATCSGNSSLLATLLEFSDKDTINRTDNLFRTPLHYACALGHAKITNQLLEAGAKINSSDSEGATPAHLAAYWNHTDCLSALIENCGPAVISNLVDSSGLTPLHWAVYRRHFDSARCLCSATTSPPSSLLLVAAANGDDAMVDLLLSNGVRVSENLDSGTSSTALISAAAHGHVTVLMTLIYRGKANPRQNDMRGRTALHWAAMSGSAQACKFLLELGCPHDSMDYLGCTALHCAAFSSADCVKVLLANLPVECKDRYGFTPLHWACLGRNAASVKLLLSAGASVNALGKTRDRQTPLDCALRRNATEAAEILVAAGGLTVHGAKHHAATVIQSAWRGHRARYTLDVVRRHELRLAKGKKVRSMSSSSVPGSPYNDGIVDAVYYGMGKNSDASSKDDDNFFDDDNSSSHARSKPQSADEVAPPLIDSTSLRNTNNRREDMELAAPFRPRANSNRSVRFAESPDSTATPNARSEMPPVKKEELVRTVSIKQAAEKIAIKTTPPEAVADVAEDKSMSLGALMSVVAMAKKNRRNSRRQSIFGVVNDDAGDDFEDEEDDDLNPDQLKQKYYRMSEEQILLQEAAAARKLRVTEMMRVEAVRARFEAASTIQRAWRRYKKNKKNTQTQKLTARQMRLRAGEHAWRRQMAAITLQNAWRKHHRNETLKVVENNPDLKQVQSPLSSLMRSTRQAVLVSHIYGRVNTALPIKRPQTSHPEKLTARPTVKPLNELSKPRPAAISFNFAHRQYTSPVITATSQTSQTFRH